MHNKLLLQPYTITCIETENFFFDKRTLLLLNLIEEFSSVKKSCEHMAISYAKAWNSLNNLEGILGYKVVKRSHGGKRGGGTILTEEGKRFINLYYNYNQKVKKFSSDCFFDMFPEFWANKNN
jgi:molybdate transport repressor ModE-like protein